MPLTGNIQVSSTTPTSVPRPKRTILVAEDSADSREMLQVLLKTKGYDVISAGDGHEAVEWQCNGRPILFS